MSGFELRSTNFGFMDCSLLKTKLSAHAFLDDLIILSESETDMQNAINIMQDFNINFSIGSNADKSKLLAINVQPVPSFLYNNVLIDPVPHNSVIRFLGTYIHGNGSATATADHIKTLWMQATNNLRKKKIALPRLQMIFKSVLLPAALYASQIHVPGQTDMEKYEKSIRQTFRRAMGLHTRTPRAVIQCPQVILAPSFSDELLLDNVGRLMVSQHHDSPDYELSKHRMNILQVSFKCPFNPIEQPHILQNVKTRHPLNRLIPELALRRLSISYSSLPGNSANHELKFNSVPSKDCLALLYTFGITNNQQLWSAPNICITWNDLQAASRRTFKTSAPPGFCEIFRVLPCPQEFSVPLTFETNLAHCLILVNDTFFYAHSVTSLGSSEYFLLLQHVKLIQNKWLSCTDSFCEHRHIHASTHCFQRRSPTLDYLRSFPISYKKLCKLSHTPLIFLSARTDTVDQNEVVQVSPNTLSALSKEFFNCLRIDNDSSWPPNATRVSFWSDGSLKFKGSPQVSSTVGIIFLALNASISGKIQAGIISSARAEVMGVVIGLSACPPSSHVTIFCDASAVVNIGKQLGKQMTTNQIICQGLGLEWNLVHFIIATCKLKTKFVWVRGHSNLKRNIEADKLANAAHNYSEIITTECFKPTRVTLFQCGKPITGDPRKHIRNLSSFVRKKAFFDRITMPAPMNRFLLKESFETYKAPMQYDQLNKYKFRIKLATDWIPVAAIRYFYIDQSSPFCRLCGDYSIEDIDHALKHCAIPLIPKNIDECQNNPFSGTQLLLANTCLNQLKATPDSRQTISGLIPEWLFECTNLFFQTRAELISFCKTLLSTILDACYLNWKTRSEISVEQEPLHGPIPNFKLHPCCNVCWKPRDKVHCFCDDKIRIPKQFFRASRKHVLNKFGFISDSWALFHHLDPTFPTTNLRGSELGAQ